MNEQTLKLIESLAEKLRTTSEYLWSVLIKQAPIESCIGIGYIVLLIGIGFGLWQIHKKLYKKTKDDDNYYGKSDCVLAIIMITIGVGWLISVIAVLSNAGNIFTGFYNPEYWALNNILDSLKPSK